MCGEALEQWCAEHVRDGGRLGRARREAARRDRRAARWREQEGLPADADLDDLFVRASGAGDWDRALRLARIALHEGR